MSHFRNILFPTDFSACSEHAGEYAVALSRNSDYKLHVVHVLDPSNLYSAGMEVSGVSVADAIDAIEERVKGALSEMSQFAGENDVEISTHLARGKPDVEIIKLADALHCGLIVIGTHGRTGFDRFLYGSTCQKVVRRSHVPVLTIKRPEHEFVEDGKIRDIDKVLCPSDLSDFSKEGIALGAELSRQCGAAMVLLHIIDSRIEYPRFMPEQACVSTSGARQEALRFLEAEAARYDDIRTEVEVATGIPHLAITEAIERHSADIAILATHGRTGIAHALLGSTTEKVVRLAPSPILTIRPNDEAYPLREGSESQCRAGA